MIHLQSSYSISDNSFAVKINRIYFVLLSLYTIFVHKMKRFILIQLLLLISGISVAQINPINEGKSMDPMNQSDPNKQKKDTTEMEGLPPKLYMWHLDERLGTVLKMDVDTTNYNFQNSNLVGGMTGHYNYLGNLGSPRLSRIFFERQADDPTMFIAPYSQFIVRPGTFKFTNSNVPYTNLTYYKGGSKEYGEERFKSYFSVNANKYFAFGFNIDYLYGRGYYNNQSTAFFNGAVFGSYMGDHYEASLIYSNNYLKMNENGGITDDRYITDPETMANGGKKYEPQNIPTNLSASNNRNRDYYVYLAHRYKLGFKRKIKVIPAGEVKSQKPLPESNVNIPDENAIKFNAGTHLKDKGKSPIKPVPKDSLNDKPAEQKKDSVVYEFVPVTSFIHTMKFEHTYHHFHSADNVKYANTYINPSQTLVNDTTSNFSLKNVFGIALLEGFNKYAKAGLTAYISHKISQYKLMDKDLVNVDKYNEQEVFVGGELSKRQGNMLHYVISGEAGLLDKAIGQFRLTGNLDFNFHLFSDTVSIIARANISNTLPDFYMRHYHAKHYYWDNDLSNEFRSRVEGELTIERLQTHLKAGVENIKNYTYFNSDATVSQKSGSIQVLSAMLNQNFRLGVLHLDNEITWQKSSNNEILPLPQLSLYHNLYIETKLAKKVLNVQIGADVRYFSSYYAPAYTPGIQQFNLQSTTDRVKLGTYPIINIYANLQLKRTRFFFMYYHANAGSGNSMYFLAPHYPINQSLLKMGLSWNFYD